MSPSSLEILQTTLGDRYHFEHEIGSGGMATVYLARDLRHDREVAVKVLKPELGAVLGADRFLSEIRVTANLQHPNLLPLFDSGEAAGLLYYVMPFVKGETLRARLDRELQLPVEEAVRIAVAVAGALGYAHEHGVIHRDLKPENILIQAGQPVIADFGIALAVSNAGGARVTQTGLSLGTPQYMSPEQAAGDRVIDARSDIYSLGAVTYEMLAGEPPHSGTSAQAIIAKLMTSDPRPLNTLRSTVPVHVMCAVEKALAKLPADRFASAHDFAAALQNPSFTIPTMSARVGAGRKRADVLRERAMIPLAAIATLAIAAAIAGWLRPSPSKQINRYAIELDSTAKLSTSFIWSRLALSPDGSRFAYVSAVQNKLYLLPRNQLHAAALPETDDAEAPFFSSDGQSIGFICKGRTLKFISVNGGPPTVVTDSLIGRAGGAWGPDGTIYMDGAGPKPLVKVKAAAGAVPQWFTQLDSGETDHTQPSVLPGGKGVMFTVRFDAKATARTGVSNAIAVADVATGKHRAILENAWFAAYSPSGHLLYVTPLGTLMVVPFDLNALKVTGAPVALAEGVRTGPFGGVNLGVSQAGTLVYVTGGAQENREVVWVTKDGKMSHVDSTWQNAFDWPALSPDGTKLAISIRNGLNGDLWVKALDRGPTLKLTFEGVNQYPTWNPDGKTVTYYSNASGASDLWNKRADGSAQAARLLHYTRALNEAVWSSDGKWLVFRTSLADPGSGDILAIRPGIDSAPIPIVATKFTEFSPTLSPDGKYLAYSSDESGTQEIYVVPFPNSSAAKWPVSTSGGTEPLWSRRGDELYYRDARGNMIAVSVKTSPTFSAVSSKTLFPASQYVSFARRRQYDISPDGSRFLMIRPISAGVPDRLIVIDNWFEEMKNKAKQ